ncbi:hypothetical protein [Pseudidiomarina insulisalsae]|uniref:Uncharacterized protein n=1 Tax=Pseudidiomarina insulisalsae TaxID=575789 RepID=A0A432YQ72_9GAMM|nr:hypothetical protein [Pseudidiomarina insulisalsae]RUO63551.1 hypothetical protein CWI71_00365 [Pseudidiomarina insulisalsae]
MWQVSHRVATICILLALAGAPLPVWAQQEEEPQTIGDDQELIDSVRSGIHTTVSATAAWLDSFFTDAVDPTEYDDVYGSLTIAPQWDEYDGVEIDSSFRARVILPHAERKFSAIIGRGDFDDFINDQQTTRPTVIRREQADEEWMVGLGFDPLVQDDHSISFGAGFRGGLQLDPYVRARYRFDEIINERSEIHLQTVGFWRDSDGFGVAQTIEHDFALSAKWFNKFWLRGTFAERIDGVRWHASEKLYYIYHHERAFGGEVWWYGETEHPVPMQDYGIKGLHRSRFLRDWLYLESWIGLHWPREYLSETRKPRWLVGIELELHFGD